LRAAACSAAKPPQDTPIIPDGAGAPRLRGEPRDHLVDVRGLLLGVLVGDEAVAVAAPAQVDPHARVAVAGEVPVPGGVAGGGAVALAVRHGVENRRHGVALGIVRQPHPGGDPAAIGQRDPQVLDGPDRPREVGSDLHRRVVVVSHTRHAEGSFVY
jgi:hypothetical protein